MALPDSGCTRTICNPEYARKCQLRVDHTEGMDMAGANGEMLSCIGSTNAVISYYGRVATIKIFVMKNFKQDFFLLSRRACQALQILPPEFPLPIQMCDPEKLTNPIVHQDPFKNKGICQGKYNSIYEDHALNIYVPRNEMSKNTTIDCSNPHDKNISVVASFNNNYEKQNAVSSLNKLLSHYPRVGVAKKIERSWK